MVGIQDFEAHGDKELHDFSFAVIYTFRSNKYFLMSLYRIKNHFDVESIRRTNPPC